MQQTKQSFIQELEDIAKNIKEDFFTQIDRALHFRARAIPQANTTRS